MYLVCSSLIIWTALNYWLKVPLGLLECLCVVGYSLAVYIPASILCVISLLSWPAVAGAFAASTAFAAKAIQPALSDRPKPMVGSFLGGIVVLNAVFALVVKFNLFS